MKMLKIIITLLIGSGSIAETNNVTTTNTAEVAARKIKVQRKPKKKIRKKQYRARKKEASNAEH